MEEDEKKIVARQLHRGRIYLPEWNKQSNKGQNTWNNGFEDTGNEERKDIDPWKMQNKVNQKHNWRYWNNNVVVGKELGGHA